jgi:hypothetical protein
MSCPTHPYEVEIHDQDGYADLIQSYRTEAQAIESMPSHIAKAQAEALASLRLQLEAEFERRLAALRVCFTCSAM